MYQAEAYRLGSCCPVSSNPIKKAITKRKKGESYESEDDNNEDMIFIRPDLNMSSKISRQ